MPVAPKLRSASSRTTIREGVGGDDGDAAAASGMVWRHSVCVDSTSLRGEGCEMQGAGGCVAEVRTTRKDTKKIDEKLVGGGSKTNCHNWRVAQ